MNNPPITPPTVSVSVSVSPTPVGSPTLPPQPKQTPPPTSATATPTPAIFTSPTATPTLPVNNPPITPPTVSVSVSVSPIPVGSPTPSLQPKQTPPPTSVTPTLAIDAIPTATPTLPVNNPPITPTNTPTPTPSGMSVDPAVIRLKTCEETERTVKVSGYSEPLNLMYSKETNADWLEIRPNRDDPSSFTVSIWKNETNEVRSEKVYFEDATTGERTCLDITQPGRLVMVTFDFNDGIPSYTVSRTYTVGEPYGELPDGPANMADSEFAGWYTKRDVGEQIKPDDIVSGYDKVFYAHYLTELVEVDFVFVAGKYDTADDAALMEALQNFQDTCISYAG